MIFAASDDGDNQRGAERCTAGLFNAFVILPGLNRPFLQQLTEAFTAFIRNNKETPGLQRPVIRGAQSGTENIFQLFTGRRRLGRSAVMLGVSADQLATVYRTAFPVLYGYDTKRDHYDQNGRLVPGPIVKAWQKDGDTLSSEDLTDTNESGNTYTYSPPFELLGRETDLRQAHGYFTELATND